MSLFGKKPPSATVPPAAGRGGSGRADAAPLPPLTELSALDFSGTDAGRGLARAAGMVEVQEVGGGIGADFEEAAVLYANGSDAEAEEVLDRVLEDPRANAGEGLWMMLLDLYRLTGQRQRFESRVLDYATRFERSPPPWVDLSGQGERRRSDLPPLVNLSGNLSAKAGDPFQQINVIARKSGAIRIDIGRLRGVDEAGCGLLRQLLVRLVADRIKVSLVNGEPLAAVLTERVAVGQAENREAWLLLLELLQHTGERDRFENLAVDYAVTFEESPPSWERKVAPPSGQGGAEAQGAGVAGDVFCFEGELGGASNEAIRRFAAFAADRRELTLDCAALRRIDFVCAGMLFNILATLQAQGKLVRLQNVNAMVAALLRVMSVDQVAQVTLRR